MALFSVSGEASSLHLSWSPTSYVEELVVSDQSRATCYVLVDIGSIELANYQFELVKADSLIIDDHYSKYSSEISQVTPIEELSGPVSSAWFWVQDCVGNSGPTCVAAFEVQFNPQYIQENPDVFVGMFPFDLSGPPVFGDWVDCGSFGSDGIPFQTWGGVHIVHMSTPLENVSLSEVKARFR